MRLASRLRAAALAAGLLAPAAAGAQTPTAPVSAEGAQALEAELRGWLTGLVGPVVDVAALPFKVIAEGEAYRLELPFGGSLLDDLLTLSEGALAATVKPLDGGRWAIESMTMPGELRLESRPTGAGEAAAGILRVESQRAQGVFDPTLATASVLEAHFTGYSMELQAKGGPQETRIGSINARTEWQPTTGGRVTLLSDTVMEGYASTTGLPDGSAAQVTIGRLSGSSRLQGADFAGTAELMRVAFALGAEARAKAGTDGKPGSGGKSGGAGKADNAAERALARQLLDRVAGLLEAMEADYAYDDIAADYGGFSGTLRKAAFGISLAAPQGRTELRLRFAIEGLASPMIPEGPWRDYVPHKVAFNPRIGGIAKEALVAFLHRAIETDGDQIEAEAMMLLAAGPLTLGLDDILIDLGPLRLVGGGAMQVTSPDEMEGTAELRASGLDALIRRANQTPDLKAAAPGLIFLKGIGRQEGAETVWKISYTDGRVMVNDTDMSDMIPSK